MQLKLTDGSLVAVVGGGPAGSFFAITLLRRARHLGRRIEVVILEKRKELAFHDLAPPESGPPGCNYCAGGISPRMNDELRAMGLSLPPEIVEDRIRSITVQLHWKNIELRVPEGREMLSVYRGSRPRARAGAHLNFDSFLLREAAREGARVVTRVVTGLRSTPSGRPEVLHHDATEATGRGESLTADFLVIAAGVNQVPGMSLEESGLVRDLRTLMSGFDPPRIRRTMIFELEAAGARDPGAEGELRFLLYGSPSLRLSLGSVMPKGRFLTVALIGPGVERIARESGGRDIASAFLSLPHIRETLPEGSYVSRASCICRPNMVVGGARNPFGDRVAVIGDMVTSRLYKDGIYSALVTARGLAEAALEAGIDRQSLRRSYGPLLRIMNRDHWFGRAVFALNAVAFRRPILSRITYQAILWERKKRRREDRWLESVLWRIASGDDAYRRIFRAMFSPRTLGLLLVGGVLVTLRNSVTELLFGLSWKGLGRFPTGVYREEFEVRTGELSDLLSVELERFRDVRRMYSIRVRRSATGILDELGRFGSKDRTYFRPRLVEVERIAGAANEVGSVIRYEVARGLLCFHLVLERRIRSRALLYRIRDGFGEGGVLVFDVEERSPVESLLTILVSFDFRVAGGLRPLLRRLFPAFVHDVLWNHSLCALKQSAEGRSRSGEIPYR